MKSLCFLDLRVKSEDDKEGETPAGPEDDKGVYPEVHQMVKKWCEC